MLMAGRKQKRDASGRFHARTPTDRNSGNSSACSDDTSSDTEMCPIVPGHQVPASGSANKRLQAMTVIKQERPISRVNSEGGNKRELSFQKVSEKLHVLNDKIDELSEKLLFLTVKIDALIDKLFRK
ncbi:hypothetical protein GUJ93_ZPchr0010g9462 [Zizania palustris]|uniref:Uncharacterized protein n=1 Tax=Zizania palustris TaxID=103762 RepID=A0A8J5TBR0_ZIZPA|nr:hypothetical protein GUJ93_ZPchr0010g9462 [Zizania palustris]